nr:MAG: putative nucleocapsid protein [Hameenlinna phasivirus]
MANFETLNDVRNEMNALVGRVDAADFVAVIRATLSEFEYQGLNVLGIVQEIYRRGLAGGRTRENVQQDVLSMILLFLSRGNNVDKMLLRTNEAGRVRINALKLLYRLANNVGRGGNAVVTLSRVAAVFPVATLKLLANGEVNIPRAVTLAVAEFGANFPKQMQTVIAAAVFPRGNNGSQLMKALLLYLIEENKLLSNVGGVPDHDILLRVIPFARASFVSSIVPNGDRPNICIGIGLLTAELQPSGSLNVAINTFNQRFPNADLNFIV